VILGPTATGKTSLAIELAKRFDGEVISADSRQVYRGLDIGTAKVTEEEMQGIPHHMIDVVNPQERYTVAQFVNTATSIIKDVHSRKKVPIICGGTGMYIDALVYSQSFPQVAPNTKLRAELEKKSTTELFILLKERDQERAQTIDHNNKVRLVRALEIVNDIGSTPQQQKQQLKYKTLCIGLDLPNDVLYQRIHERIVDRLDHQHMLDEARKLHADGVSYERMEELGLEYRYMAKYLQGEMSYDDMIEELSAKTRQFVKRQRTWFKRNANIHWYNPITDTETIYQHVERFLRA